jgi:steroid delta-isomerase-like uncharacterized protein
MAEDLEALARRFNDEILTQGKVELIDELVADDFVEHQMVPGVGGSGKDALRGFVATTRSAFPDFAVETLAVIAAGDEVWIHSRMTGTHQGEFAGIPATGNSIAVEMIDRVRVRDGKAIEHWGVSDDLGMMTQLGALPDMG